MSVDEEPLVREQLAEAARVVAEPPESRPPGRPEPRAVWFVRHAPALILSVAALVTSVQSCRGAGERTDAVYDALRARIEAQDKAVAQTHADVVALQGWLRGYLSATGVHVATTPGEPAAEPVRVDVRPAPSASVAPAVVVPPPAASGHRPPRPEPPVPATIHVLTPLPQAADLARPRPLPASAPGG